MEKDKKILQELEAECKALYEILLNMLHTLRTIAEILNKSKNENVILWLKEALATYIHAYNHARGIRVMVAFFMKI